MSDVYLSSGETFTRYIGNPLKQLNMGYTLTSFFYLAAVFIGLLLMFILSFILLFNEGYKNNSVSKRAIIILGWVGFSLTLVGIWLTINNFYTVTNKINKIVKQKRNCALFLPESAESAIKILVSEAVADQRIEEILQVRKDQAIVPLGRQGEVLAGDPYLVSDAGGSVIAPEVNPELYGLALPAKSAFDESTLKALREGRYQGRDVAGAQQYVKDVFGLGQQQARGLPAQAQQAREFEDRLKQLEGLVPRQSSNRPAALPGAPLPQGRSVQSSLSRAAVKPNQFRNLIPPLNQVRQGTPAANVVPNAPRTTPATMAQPGERVVPGPEGGRYM